MTIMNRVYSIFITTAMCLSLVCCGVYGTYTRPQLDISIDSLYTDPIDVDSTPTAHIPWREFFTDSSLQSLIERALERNTDLAVARLSVEQAQATLSTARLQYLPSLSLDAQAGTSHFNGSTTSTYSAGISAQWEADIFGNITSARRGSAEALRAQIFYTQAVQTQLIATVAETYCTLLMLDEQLAIARATAVNWEQTIATLQALTAAGRSNEVAVSQAQANHTALMATIVSLEKTISDTESQLCALLKDPVHPIERTSLNNQNFPEQIATGIPIDLLTNRPDVRQAEAELAQAFYLTNNARAAFYPRVTLGGTIGFTNSAGAVVNPGQWLTSAIAQLTAPLFNRGVNRANLEIARARQEQAVAMFEQAIINAAIQVNDALTAVQTAEQLERLDIEQIKQLETACQHTELLMRYTSYTYLEVLTAQQSLLNAQLTLCHDQASHFIALINLYHALGGGCY